MLVLPSHDKHRQRMSCHHIFFETDHQRELLTSGHNHPPGDAAVFCSSCPPGATGLPCGGDGVVSVYGTRGPYMLHARATSDGVVVEGRKTAIQVLVQFASKPTIELGKSHSIQFIGMEFK